MKPNSRIIFSFVSIIFVLSIIISPVTSAQEQKHEEKQQVDELTEELEYYFKDAEIHNDEGEIVVEMTSIKQGVMFDDKLRIF